MSNWNTERARHKAERRSPAPEPNRIPNKLKKIAKPWAVMYDPRKDKKTLARFLLGRGPRKVSSFATEAEAQKYVEKLGRSHSYIGEHWGPQQVEEAKARWKSYLDAHYIVGPDQPKEKQ